MRTLNYVSNIPLKESSGGGSGINYAMHQELQKYFHVKVFPAINPSPDYFKKVLSKFCRILSIKANYHHFSESRLIAINSQFQKYDLKADAFFFHGFTPWIKINTNKPYYCFNDACFATYVEIYNNKEAFSSSDLKRIYQQEALWLKNASKVFFRSHWALEETKKHYKLTGENFINVGVGGFIDIPEDDFYTGGYDFLFISREFIPKGGMSTVKAFIEVQKKNSEARLIIVGDAPPQEVMKIDGVIYKGFFSKSNEAEKEKLVEIFRKSFALIHPTIKDTNTLVITELAYYGCPAISTNGFAIPEYLLDGETGFLLENPRKRN